MSTPITRRPLSARQNKNAGSPGKPVLLPNSRNVSGTFKTASPAKNSASDPSSKITHPEPQNAHLARRLADLTQDNERTEQALVEKDVLLERTRERVKLLEREAAGWEKRLEHQKQGFDLERQQWTDTHEADRTRLERLQREKKRLVDRVDQLEAEREGRSVLLDDKDPSGTLGRPTSPLPHAELARLFDSLSETQATLSHLQKTHLELQHRLARSESTVKEEKEINERLREENEVWEKLVGTRTIDGTIGIGLGIGFGFGGGGAPPLAVDHGTIKSTVGSVSKASRRERGKSLADELGRFDLEAFGKGEMDQTSKPAQDAEMDKIKEENEDLRLELKHLSEANRGLRLYCSKILDRILSHSDSEQFLADVSSDPATSRKIPVRPTRQRQASNRVRPQSVLYSSNSEELVAQVDPKTGLRPLSMLAGRTDSPSPEPPKTEPDSASDKRARRGLSLNWGSFAGFGGGGPSGTPSPRTETGPSIPEPRAGSESPAARVGGRKLQTHEEDDEDRVERERLAATMKLMGVDAPAENGSPHLLSPNTTGQGIQRSSSAQSNVSATSSSANNVRPARPVSRWSSFFGRSASAEPASIESTPGPAETIVESPPLGDLADTIKQAHAQRKKEEHETLRHNKNLTKAPRSVMDIIAARPVKAHHEVKKSVDSMGSLEDMRKPMTMQSDSERDGEHKPKGSISTLFDVSMNDN